MRWGSLLFPLIAFFTVQAQPGRPLRVVDAENGTPLPYATILVHGTAKGTITNSEGGFELPELRDHDTLRISFVGYITRYIAYPEAVSTGKIAMERAQFQLGEVTVRPGEPQYKRVMAAARWLARTPEVRSKMFFGIETHKDTVPVEMIHAYYNAHTRGGRLRQLDMKQGRIGIKDISGRFFINFNTTRAFALMDIFSGRGLFPDSPLGVSGVAEMKRYFTAQLISEGTGTDGIDHIKVVPRHPGSARFTLDLWLAHKSDQVRALELHCTDCAIHPFRPLFEGGRIDTIDMRFRQTWSTSGEYMPEVMELGLRTVYSGIGFSEAFRTHAVMHAFEPGGSFILPLFNYPEGISDYHRIGWLPEDTLFWQRMHPPLPTERQQRDMAFLLDHDLRQDENRTYSHIERRQLSPFYGIWSADRRFLLQGLSLYPPPEIRTRRRESAIENLHVYALGPLMDLVAQFHLDLDTLDGRLLHRSVTVLDGAFSFDHRAEHPWTDAFHNIWLDMCEIERRKMEARLNAIGPDLDQAGSIHAEYSEKLIALKAAYLNDTQHGEFLDQVKVYNDRVRDQLGIDNLAIFGLQAY